MDNEARYSLIGGVVLVLGILLAASLVWLMDGSEKNDYQNYSIYFRHQSMDGLDANSAVKLRGVKIGVVSDYGFVAGSDEAVRVNVKLNASTPIHIDSRAFIKRNVVTGIATVEISSPQANSPLLTEVLPSERYPVIAEGSSDLDKVTTDLSKMAESGAQLLDKMNLLLSDNNRASVTKTLDNLQQLSTQLVVHKQALNNTIQSFEDAAIAIKSTANNVDTATADLDGQLRTLTQKASATLDQATASMADIQQQSVIISKQLQTLTNTANYQLKQVGRDVREGSAALTATSQRYANPRELLFSTGKTETAPGESK
ncbi:MAG: MCE family protein [Sulfuriferula sp.]|nr:MCE family protein [Sulfuriferula sp.]